jgi:hypothetical protein
MLSSSASGLSAIHVLSFIFEITARTQGFIFNTGLTFDGNLVTLENKSSPDFAAVGDCFLTAFADRF